jgi:2-methylcitrate dehydratase PrpD
MVKAFHPGKCGADAYLAVQLAKRGFLSNPAIMEDAEGFANATTKTIDYDDFLAELEKKESLFAKPGLNMKPWPCCKHNHSSINAIQNLRANYGFTANDVEKVECFMQPIGFESLKYTVPTTKDQGKFSIQYNLALTIAHGNVTLSDYDGNVIDDPLIIDLMNKITMIIDDSIAHGKYSNGTFDSKVKVRLKDGRVLEEWVVDAKGDPGNPLSFGEVIDKFNACAVRALDMNKADRIRNDIAQIDKLATVKELLDAISDAAK